MGMFQFINNYQENEALRKSFNDLATRTFGINFEEWYRRGYWTERYQPYSYIYQDQVVANVSVNLVDLNVENERIKAVQIGTVMTQPEFQGRGLSKRLMEKVLKDYQSKIDVFYLFANNSVKGYYPKFGFKQIDECVYSQPYNKTNPSKKVDIKKLNIYDDLPFIYQFAKKRRPVSSRFSTMNTDELTMFYSIYVFQDNIAYITEENAIVFYQIDEGILHLFNIISQSAFQLNSIIEKLGDDQTKNVVFHFTPEIVTENMMIQPFQGNETLFVKMKNDYIFPDEFKHPILSQA